MKKLFRLLFIALIPLAAVSCAQDDMTPAISQPDTPAAETQPGLLRSAAEAIQQAITDRNNMLGIPTPGSRAELDVKCIKRPAPSRSGENDTLLYVVNFPDEEGYAVIPADRRIETLAVTEAGSFSSIDEMQNPAAKEFMKAATTYATYGFTVDTTIVKPTRPEPETPKQYQIFDTVSEINVPAKISLRWGQFGSLAKYATNNSPNYPHRAAGCVPLACALVLSYFEQPRSMDLTFTGRPVSTTPLNWGIMKTHVREFDVMSDNNCYCRTSPEAHEQLARLLRQLGVSCNANYLSNVKGNPVTSAALGGAYNTLKKLLPAVPVTVRTTLSNLKSDLKNGILVMEGTDADGGAHCWICDGYYYLKYDVNIYEESPLHTTIGHPNLKFIQTLQTFVVEYMHVNWGWDGRDNGFFSYGVFDSSRVVREDNPSDGSAERRVYSYIPDYIYVQV